MPARTDTDMTMISSSLSRRRRSIPRHTNRQRQRSIAIACSLALLSMGSHKKYRNEILDRERDDLSMWMWRSKSFVYSTAAAPAPTYQHQSSTNEGDESTLPRPLNYYEMLNLESPDTHRRPKTGKLHSRKKRANYRARINKDQIKKAYRKQAQLYHPDKASRHNMTAEESNARFSEIAEAYQVLVDPVQRYDYDWELLEMEEEFEEERLNFEEEQKEMKRQQQYYEEGQRYNMDGDDSSLYEKVRNGASNFQAWKDSFDLDPWAVFEDFFFQDSTMSDADTNPSTENERHRQAHNQNSHNYQPPPSHTQMPPRVSETTMYRGYDPGFGADVYTVLRREEYIHDMNENGEYFYQILGQDFISGTRKDPHTGFTMQEYYSAVTDAYFVEEGYVKRDSDVGKDNYAGKNSAYNNEQNEQKAQSQTPIHRTSPSKLEEGESVTPNSISNEENAWVSPNRKYQVILTPTCELQIIHRDEQQNHSESSHASYIETTVIWSSETYIPDTRAHGCHLTLKPTGRLVLSVDYGSGLGSVGNTVLWSSPLPKVVPHSIQDDDDGTKQQPVTFWHIASLDDDGVIAVYRVRERVSSRSDNGQKREQSSTHQSSKSRKATSNSSTISRMHIRPIINKLGSMYRRISKSSAQQGQTKAALVWGELRYKVGRIFAGRPWAVVVDQPDSNSWHECVYSTSPAGCLAPGRNAIHLTKKFAHSLKQSVQSIDSQLDHFLSALTEPAPDYDYDGFNFGYDSTGGHDQWDGASFLDSFDEDDEDILDTLIRVTGAAGVQLGKAGIHAAQLGMKRGRKVAGKVVGKMKDRMGKDSSLWGEDW